MNDTEFIERYNKVIERMKKAEKFMETATANQVEKWLADYNKVVIELSFLQNWYIKRFGYTSEYYILFVSY